MVQNRSLLPREVLLVAMVCSLGSCDANDSEKPENWHGDDDWDHPVHVAIRNSVNGPNHGFPEPYVNALHAVANFRSCPGAWQGAVTNDLLDQLQKIKDQGAAKGMLPLLEKQEQQYLLFRRGASFQACGGGPEWSEKYARDQLKAFQDWISEQPSR